MVWARLGDQCAFNPLLLEISGHPEFDDRLINECFGFIVRCATQAAAHLTDYRVSRGTALAIAGPSRVDTLLAVCEFAGLITWQEVDGVEWWTLVSDEPDFLHLRLKRDIEWERQRQRDGKTPFLVVPVRLRDGDGCRWCGGIVNWADRKSGRGGTYDHLDPGEPATVDTYVVACRSCNSSRQAGETPAGSTGLLEAPENPIFSEYTIKWLTENRWRRDNGYSIPDATPHSELDKFVRKARSQRARTTTQSSAPSGDSPGMTAAQSDTAPSATPVSGTAAMSATQESASPRPGMTAALSATPDTQGKDKAANRAGPRRTTAVPPSQGGTADQPPPPRSTRNQGDRADRKGRSSNPTGRVGSGRAGPGSADTPQPPSAHSQRNSRPRRRGGRGGRSRPKD